MPQDILFGEVFASLMAFKLIKLIILSESECSVQYLALAAGMHIPNTYMYKPLFHELGANHVAIANHKY